MHLIVENEGETIDKSALHEQRIRSKRSSSLSKDHECKEMLSVYLQETSANCFGHLLLTFFDQSGQSQICIVLTQGRAP